MNFIADLDCGAIRQQHPYRDLQPFSASIDDTDRAISPLGPSEDLKSKTIKRMERIENPNLVTFANRVLWARMFSSAHPLRHCRRRPCAGSLTMDLRPAIVLPAHRRTQPCLPRQVRRRTAQRVPAKCAPVPRRASAASSTARLRYLAEGTVPARLGRLFQTALRRPEHVLRYLGAYTIASPSPTPG